MAEILVVDCGSDSGIQSVLLDLLAGLRVEVVRSVGELQQRLPDLTTDGPCAVLCVACSADNESRGVVDETLRSVGSMPVLVIDESLDHDYGHRLIRQGVQDYLSDENVSTEELHLRIEYAILRNGHRAPALPPPRVHTADVDQSEVRRIYKGLPPRQQEVLDLYLGRQTAKQIARRLGISVKTVHSQLARLRSKFSADSSPELIIVVLGALQQQ
ncbi:MAG: sigma factor-like helix-turn-helix DNA-binding protein [Planctomycetota bacterium]|nr:sigma factor-like helix-turn-helix DNA-binding protein [Planctomycetota bacterium]